MPAKRKQLHLSLTVTAPAWMTAEMIRREVRSLINHQSNFLDWSPHGEIGPESIKVRKLGPKCRM